MTGDNINIKGTLGSAGGQIVLQTRGRPVVGIEVSGVFSQQLQINELENGDNARAAQVFNAAGVGISATITSPGLFFVNAAGRSAITVTQTAFTSGSAVIFMNAGYGSIGGSGGGGGGGGAVTVADGADVTQGATTDAAVTGDNPGTISAKLRGLLKVIANILPVRLQDGTSSNLATVIPLHTTDNQSPGGTANGVLTGGVAQLINSVARLDRQRETGADNISAVGVATGTQQLKSPISTTVSAGGGAGSTAVTLAATKFTNRGSQAWIGVGSVLTFEPGTTNQEMAAVTAVNYGTNVVTIFGLGGGNGLVNTHANGSAVVTGAYNEARDATAPDGSTGAGFAAGATYLLNNTLNAGSGGWEGERSFLGELAGATGAGAAIAQEYEDTAGGPVLASGVPSGLRLMPAQSLQGKSRQFQTITSTTAGNTSITFSGGASATNLVLPGWPLLLAGGSTSEVVYTSQTWVPGSSATVPLQSPVVNTGQTSAAFDAYAVNGPGLNGFNAFGIGIEEECVFDPVTSLYYIERSATQDGVTAQNVVMESPALWNGATMDRQRDATAANGTATGVEAAGAMLWDAVNSVYRRLLANIDGSLPVGGFTKQVSASLTRPANTTTYTASTAVANATSAASQITFANAARNAAGSGWIIGATILDEANQATKGTFELWLFNTTIGTITNDDANWTPANADLTNLVGIIKFDSGTVGNNTSGASGNVVFTDTMSKPIPFKLPSGTSLFAQLVVRNAYVPVSAEVFNIQLLVGQD